MALHLVIDVEAETSQEVHRDEVAVAVVTVGLDVAQDGEVGKCLVRAAADVVIDRNFIDTIKEYRVEAHECPIGNFPRKNEHTDDKIGARASYGKDEVAENECFASCLDFIIPSVDAEQCRSLHA